MMGRADMGAAVSLARATEATLTEARRVFEEAKLDLQIREGDLKDLRVRATSLADARTKHDKALERHGLAMQHLLEGVAEKFRGVDLRRVIGDYHAKPAVDEAHRARIAELAGLIDRIGPVNLDAMRECEEEEKRFTFYDVQKKDLESALADLEAAIAQMDQESKRLFAETFEAVNKNFQVLFPKMFRGGVAKLALTNPDDMLETGIEILAQPPGKKLGNIELMSGGEKALTAVSLIFAMFQHKPSPFCILDEVDAPLDEANVARYNEAIRSMTDKFAVHPHHPHQAHDAERRRALRCHDARARRLEARERQGQRPGAETQSGARARWGRRRRMSKSPSVPPPAGDRREGDRHLACAFAHVAPEDGGVRRAVIADISLTGARLLTRARFAAGDEVGLTLHLPSGMVEMRASVVRHEARPAEVAEMWPYEAAVRFETPLAVDEAVLRDLAARQALSLTYCPPTLACTTMSGAASLDVWVMSTPIAVG